MGIAWSFPKQVSLQVFTHIDVWETIRKRTEGKWFWKLERSLQVKYTYITATSSNSTVSFGMRLAVKTWKFLTHTQAWYTFFSYIYLPLLRYFLVMTTFEIFHHKKFIVENYAIPYFWISTAIRNPIDIFCRWCKFRRLLGQVKSRHFSERIDRASIDSCFLYHKNAGVGVKL